METIKYTHTDGYVTELLFYPCDTPPKATMLLLHGMAEHYERYCNFISFLNSNGIDCYIFNYRGHGKEFTVASQGNALKGRAHNTYVMDVIRIAKYIRQHKRTSSFFLYGHSFGSILARNVIQKDSDFSGIILGSTTYYSPVNAHFTAALASCICFFTGRHKKGSLFDRIIFGNKQYQCFEGRTYYDWISSDNVEVGKYINDQYCGYIYANGFYKDLAILNKYASSAKRIRRTDKSLPIILLSGSKDPVTNFTKSIEALEGLYDRLGFTNVSSIIYPDARHEILNDISRDNVMSDILEFISTNTGR